MAEGVRLQNLRDFTVQIRNDADQIIGTGIAVSADGKIVTCAHVVDAAGIDPRNANDAELQVYYPQLRGSEGKSRRARVSTCFADYDDDLVLLQLCDGYSPLGLENMPVLGTADSSRGDPFNSYGYRKLDIYNAGWSEGIIQGHVECPPSRKLQAEPVQLKSNQINRGMSGAAVLDTERNLVIGVVSEIWVPDKFMKDSDTAWAVDGHIIYKLASLAKVEGLFFQEESLALSPAPSPKVDIAETQSMVAPKSRFAWHNAPQPLDEWIGRTELLNALNSDWQNPNRHVTGLIGFGGEGKSSLARKWVDSLLKDSSQQQPDNVFWWGFYENHNVDEFLEVALNFLSGGKIDPRAVPSSGLRAQIIGAMLGAGRYLFVLDGLEVLQHQEGDQYGLLQNNDLRDLLTYFARSDNLSFCLITSRVPVLDLMEYTTYTHRDVERLSEADGISLLEKLGVKGSKEQMGKVISDWDGHALTIGLLSSYLAEKYGGDIARLTDIPVPTADQLRYERVHRVLRRYDEHLNDTEREFLKLFSVFRLPVKESAFEKVFEPLLKSLDQQSLLKLVSRLANYRLIRHDEHGKSFTTHPLIRNHYFTLFAKGDPLQNKVAHEQIKDYYLSFADDSFQYTTLDTLKPLIEAVHHACLGGQYDEAHHIHKDRINPMDEKGSYLLVNKLGAYQTELEIVLDFFPERDANSNPRGDSSYILNQIGYCLGGLGRLGESLAFLRRSCQSSVEKNDWARGSQAYRTLAEICSTMGLLDEGNKAISEALLLAHKAGSRALVVGSLATQGWIADLRGNLNVAGMAFFEAEALERESSPNSKYLTKQPGCHHATFLRHIGDIEYARQIIEFNIQFCYHERRFYNLSECYRVLGDLEATATQYSNARNHYNEAVRIARTTIQRNVLIRALEVRGCFLARQGDVISAHSDLEEALSYVIDGGHRLHEVSVRTGLAWVYLAKGEIQSAKQSSQRALQMSQEMGYHWGKVDAEEVLGAVTEREKDLL